MKLTFCIPPRTDEFYPDRIRIVASDGEGMEIQPQGQPFTLWTDEVTAQIYRIQAHAIASGDFEYLREITEFDYNLYTF